MIDNKRVTLKDIAIRANVSTSTVCRALQNSHDIGREKKDEIKAIAKELGYKPNLVARSLRLMKTNVIGVVVPDNTNPYFAAMLKGIEEKARANGFIVVVINTNENNDDEIEAVSTLSDLQVAGILAIPIKQQNYEHVQEHLIFLSRGNFEKGDDQYNYIIDDDVEGAYLATAHLLSKGIKKIYYIGGINKSIVTEKRVEGCKKAFLESGIDFDENRVVYDNLSMYDGYKALSSILIKESSPIGVFCNSDYVAIGAIKAIKESGWQIPNQVSLVGYDDIDIVSYMDIPLTTIRQAKYDLGTWATEVLIDRINNQSAINEKFQKILQPELIVRKTT